MIEKGKHEKKEGVYLGTGRKKNSEFREDEYLALRRENMVTCLKMGKNCLFYNITSYED